MNRTAPVSGRWIGSWTGRFLVLICIWLLPFVRFLLHGQYGFLRVEALVPLALGVLICAAAAVVLRSSALFGLVITGSIVLLSAYPVHSYLEPYISLQYRWVLIGLSAVLLMAYVLMKEVFLQLAAIFALGMFCVAIGQRLANRTQAEPVAAAPLPQNAARPAHAVYLIFDEFLGLAGFPRDIPECAETAGQIQSMLLRHGFDVYPNAYSNYADTADSIPSIVNFALEPPSGFLRRMRLRSEGLFSSFESRGYKVAIYQSDFIDFQAPGLDSSNIAATYAANTIGKIEDLPIAWDKKARHIVASYVQADEFFYGRLKRSSPSSWLVQDRRIGPLAVTGVWPDRLARDIRGASQKTLFFAHLLTPHYPYVFDRDGNLRAYEDWGAGFSLKTSDPAIHRKLYQRYCEQAGHLSHQIDGFLQSLETSPSYESTWIVLHGDHGSRLDLTTRDPAELRSVLDHFSTLLAVKPASASSGRMLPRKASVLRILAEMIAPQAAAKLTDNADKAFLRETAGGYRTIPILTIWREP
jgi:Sulfatase